MHMSIIPNAVWKHALAAVCALVCLLTFAVLPVHATQKEIPDFCMPILEAWGAEDGKELHLRILEFWNESLDLYNNKLAWPLTIRLGGTTEELIADPKSWDLAIVSSKDVDLQTLADNGLIMSEGYVPLDPIALHQWLLPEGIQRQLPVDPIRMFSVFCYDYDPQEDDATLLICQENFGKKKNNPRVPSVFAKPILNRRTAEQARAVEGISRIEASTDEAERRESQSQILQWHMEELLQKPEAWDIADVLIHDESELDALDQAGLLYDFSQDEYWLERSIDWPVPNAIFSGDGRLIAVPYKPFLSQKQGMFRVLIINQQAADIPRTLAYAQHFIRSNEWIYTFDRDSQPKETRKYGYCIYKHEVDW